MTGLAGSIVRVMSMLVILEGKVGIVIVEILIPLLFYLVMVLLFLIFIHCLIILALYIIHSCLFSLVMICSGLLRHCRHMLRKVSRGLAARIHKSQTHQVLLHLKKLIHLLHLRLSGELLPRKLKLDIDILSIVLHIVHKYPIIILTFIKISLFSTRLIEVLLWLILL